jgi:hypothetical protein
VFFFVSCQKKQTEKEKKKKRAATFNKTTNKRILLIEMGGGKKNKVNGTGKVLAKSKLKMKKGNLGKSHASNASRYVTRNEALNKLQLKLSDFRRL